MCESSAMAAADSVDLSFGNQSEAFAMSAKAKRGPSTSEERKEARRIRACTGKERGKARKRCYREDRGNTRGPTRGGRDAPPSFGGGFGLLAPWQAGVRLQLGGPCGSYYGQGYHSDYGGQWGDDRYAIDIGVCGGGDYGTPIVAAHDGVVQRSYFNSAYGENVVVEASRCGLATRYAHLARRTVSVGERVTAGDVIGYMGYTGTARTRANTHLHFAAYSSCRGGAGLAPATMSGQQVCNACWITGTGKPQPPPDLIFTNMRVFSSDTLQVTAGGVVRAVVTAHYDGPKPIPCFYARLGVRGDSPARFADMRAGAWPSSPWIAPNRVAPVNCNGNLNPGQDARWDLAFYVPFDTAPGTYLTGVYSPLYEGDRWAEARTPITLSVERPTPRWPEPPGNAPLYAGDYVDQSSPGVLTPGEKGTYRLRIRNLGRTKWGSDVHIGTVDDKPFQFGADGVIGGARNRVGFEDEDGDGLVSYSEIATFTYTLAPPAGQSAAFRQYLRLVRDASPPDGRQIYRSDGLDPRYYLPTVIADANNFPPRLTAADCTFAYAGQGPVGTGPVGSEADPVVVTSSTSQRYFFRLRNTSELCPWVRSRFRLSTERPTDRPSGFSNGGTAESWLSSNRIGLSQAVVAPGETVEVAFEIKPSAAVASGLYREYFAPVMEGLWHYPDFGMFVPVRKQ